MDIKVLGTGCSKCKVLDQSVRIAVEEMAIEATVEKVEDIQKIMEYGVMRTPGLVINGKVVLEGLLLTPEQLKEIIKQNQ